MIHRMIMAFLCLSAFASGCMTAGPPNNVGFDRIIVLSELNGTYANRGEGAKKVASKYLSELIWPRADMDHSKIDAISVRAFDDKTLAVKAMRQGTIVRESVFVKGRDFEMRAGAIRLTTDVSVINASGRAPIPGPNYQCIELGIDQEGDGKYRETEFAPAYVYLFGGKIGFRDDVKFKRISD